MFLNKKEKDKLRKMIEEKLKFVPEGYKITLEKELLEELLFKKEIIDPKLNIVAKLPVWSGSFLKKIDLSEISFDGVCWGKMYFKPNIEEKYSKELSDINYSYTNAKIDFAKSYDMFSRPGKRGLFISDCNFEGLDLSNNNFDNLDVSFSHTNLKNAKINLKKAKSISIDSSNFEGIDLSWINVDLEEFICGTGKISLLDSNFSYTGLKIYGDINSLSYKFLNMFNEAIKANCLLGCYINGILISSDKVSYNQNKSKENIIDSGKVSYNQNRSKENIIDSVRNDIVGQISQMKRR